MTTTGTTRVCPQCGIPNRIPPRFLAAEGKCGACKATLPPTAEPIEADSALFDDIIRESRVPILVDFWADWCGPCRAAAPEVSNLAREMAGKALVLKVDTEKHPDLATRYRVSSIPNFLVFRDGKLVSQQAGLAPRHQMRRWLESASAVGV